MRPKAQLTKNTSSISYSTKLVAPTDEIVAEVCDKTTLIFYKLCHLLGALRYTLSEKADGQGKGGK